MIDTVISDFVMRLMEQAPTVGALLYLVVRLDTKLSHCVESILELLMDMEGYDPRDK